MHLKIDRLGSVRTFEFTIEKVSELLQRNGLRVVAGGLVPQGVPDDYARCFTGGK